MAGAVPNSKGSFTIKNASRNANMELGCRDLK
jgi:hypothetical protein